MCTVIVLIIQLSSISLCVSMIEIIVGHYDSRHKGSLILLPYLGHTIFSSDTLADMFT